MEKIIVIIISYLLGSIPFAYIMTRLLKGIDIREVGSGNVGSTNALRTAGKTVAVTALTGDLLKGFVAVWLGMHYGGDGLAAGCALAVVAGHCWPVFLSFKGGKGIATTAGVLLYLMPKMFIILVLIFILIVILSRYVSLGSITVAVLFPLLTFIFNDSASISIMSFILMLMVVYRHRKNIKHLLDGTERKISL